MVAGRYKETRFYSRYFSYVIFSAEKLELISGSRALSQNIVSSGISKLRGSKARRKGKTLAAVRHRK